MKNKHFSMKSVRKGKETFKAIDDKINVSMAFSNVKDTEPFEDFLVENIMENHYESEDEKPPRHSQAGKIRDLQLTLNSINFLLLLLVISYVGSRLNYYGCHDI